VSLFDHEKRIEEDESEVDMLPRGIDEKISHGPAKKQLSTVPYDM
jgi:hypothetical protein